MQPTFAVLILLIPSVISLKCYVCNSNENNDCSDGSHLANFARICNQTVDPYCRKIEQTIHKQSSVVRTCGSKTGSKACYKTAGLNYANVCSCNEDLCNNAINLNRQQRFLMMISSIAILAMPILLPR